MSQQEFETTAKVLKVDEGLGLVFGWAIVSTVDGEPHFDHQGDHIPEDALLDASLEFALQKSRPNNEMHVRSDAGEVPFIFPMTADVAKAFGIETSQTGLMIGAKPDPEQLAKFASGELTGFSIGGHRIEDRPVEEED